MYKIQIGERWISKDNILVLTDNEKDAAKLSYKTAQSIMLMLEYAYGKELKMEEV